MSASVGTQRSACSVPSGTCNEVAESHATGSASSLSCRGPTPPLTHGGSAMGNHT
jgi:hypothetical protein